MTARRPPGCPIGRGLAAILDVSHAPGGGAPPPDADGRAPLHGQVDPVLGDVGLVEVVDPRSLGVVAAAAADRQSAKATRVSYAATYRRLVALAGPGRPR